MRAACTDDDVLTSPISDSQHRLLASHRIHVDSAVFADENSSQMSKYLVLPLFAAADVIYGQKVALPVN